MSTEDALLKAIAAKPEDDEPRIIYADWLDANDTGDGRRHDRAEFIRIQCALARMGEDDKCRTTLQAREHVLLDGQRDEWLNHLREYGVTDVRFRRGAPEWVCISADDFINNMGKVFELIPVCEAGITDCQDTQALANSSHLANLTHLDLQYSGIGNTVARALADSPHLSRLTHLNLACNYIGDAGVLALAESPHLSRLTHLNLAHNDIEEAGALALAESPHLSRLTHLNLADNDIKEAGAQALSESSHLANLIFLNLDCNRIGPAVLQEIQRCFQSRRARPQNQERGCH
jgi:uncharacterized protein (TIGR02996 family)